MDALRQHFKPEFLNRIDEVIFFHALGRDDIRRIIDIQLRALLQAAGGPEDPAASSPTRRETCSSKRATIRSTARGRSSARSSGGCSTRWRWASCRATSGKATSSASTPTRARSCCGETRLSVRGAAATAVDASEPDAVADPTHVDCRAAPAAAARPSDFARLVWRRPCSCSLARVRRWSCRAARRARRSPTREFKSLVAQGRVTEVVDQQPTRSAASIRTAEQRRERRVHDDPRRGSEARRAARRPEGQVLRAKSQSRWLTELLSWVLPLLVLIVGSGRSSSGGWAAPRAASCRSRAAAPRSTPKTT